MRQNCPVCNKYSLEITRLSCCRCGLDYSGKFAISPLARLSGEEAKLALKLILCGGSLKHLALDLEISYPTLRKRIDHLIESLGKFCKQDEERIDQLIIDMETGEINADEGIRLIQEIKGEA